MAAEDRKPLWSGDRQALHDLIVGVDSDLAGLYRQAILQLETPAPRGEEKARLSLIAHAVRELMNNLPDSLGDVADLPAAAGDSEGRARRGLVDAFEEFSGGPADLHPESPEASEPTALVTVPRVLLRAVGRLVGVIRTGQRRDELRDSATVLGSRDRLDPALRPWREAREFFMQFAHLDRFKAMGTDARPLPTDDEVLAQIEIIEASLRVRLGAFFDNLQEVRALAEAANARGSIGHVVPVDDEVRAALARLGSLQLRRAFYAQLENPHWVAALAARGAFRNAPAMRLEEDGTYRVDPWPEIDYLVRMAPIASSDVVSVLKPISTSDNQWVRRGIVEAAVNLAPVDAAQLAPELAHWPRDDIANFRIDPNDVAQLIVNLLERGEHRNGMNLANAFFTPCAPARQPHIGLPEPAAGIEAYWYAERVPAVAKALGTSRIRTLERWLRAYQQHSNSFAGEPGSDMSHIWRPSIRATTDHHAHEIGDSLIDALRAALAEATSVRIDSLARLLQDDQPLMRRIALDVLAEAIEHLPDEQPSEPNDHVTALAAQAAVVLGDEIFTEGEYRVEYVPFVRACLAWGDVDLSPFFDSVRLGPLAVRDERRVRFVREGDTPADTRARIEDYRKRWQHTMLTLVGQDVLPLDLAEILAALDTEYGVLEVRDGEIYVGDFVGPTSPLEAETMCALTDDDLIGHLRSWHPEPDTWMGPSHEGQGRVLSQVIAMQPGRLSGRIADLKSLRPTYIRAIVRGWKEAIKPGNTPPWAEILALCEWGAELGSDAKFASEGDRFDDDPDYRNLRFELLQLLEAGLAIGPSEGDPGIDELYAQRVGAILARYVTDSEPTADREASDMAGNQDPLTVSINAIRPEAIRALIRAVNRFPETDAACQALSILDEHVAGTDTSLAVAAAVGEGGGRLFDSAESWIEERVGPIFGEGLPTQVYQQVALSTALAAHRYHPGLIDLLRGPLLLMVEEIPGVEHVPGWLSHPRTYDQLIGDWIMRAIIDGHLGHDDPLVQAWFEHADAGLRGDVLAHLSWLTTQWRKMPADILRRVADLWDWRIAHVRADPEDASELAGIYWLARSDKFEIEWWLPRLEYASSVVPDFQTHGMLGEKLADCSFIDPGRALQVLQNVLGGGAPGGSRTEYDLMEHAAPQVIASALDAPDSELRERATGLMNRLGQGGFIDLQDRVNSLRNSSAGSEPRP